MTYHHLSQTERYQISALLKAGLTQSQISMNLGRHKSTISREIGRLFEAVYRELQERSADRHPFTDWELAARERVRAGILRKEARTFRNRRPL